MATDDGYFDFSDPSPNLMGDDLFTSDSSSWYGDVWDNLFTDNSFENNTNNFDYVPPTDDTESWWGKKADELGDFFTSKEGISSILGAGKGFLQMYQESEKEKYNRDQLAAKEALAREDMKFKALIELAKLKYGPQGGGGGGGGGSASRRNELMIAALTKGADEKVAALNNLAQNYGAAVTRNR